MERDGLSADLVSLDGSALVRLSGELCAGTADRLEDVTDIAWRRSRGDLILDLSGLTYLDSDGVRALVVAWRRWRDGGRRLLVRGQQGLPARVLEVCGLLPVLAVSPPDGSEGAAGRTPSSATPAPG